MTSTSGPGTSSSSSSGRQRRMGPAPFASFEDLSDELESPDDKNVAGSVVRLPGIREDLTPTTPGHMDRSPSPSGFPYKGISLIGAVSNPPPVTTTTEPTNLSIKTTIKPLGMPRIDISRASSSSHHDSRDSSPEREFLESHDPTSAKLGLGFKEDGALDLRSSTEELDFQDMGERKKSKPRPPSPLVQEEILAHGRKDSQCSDIVLLSISGRTSRLSSIGSQGSAHSGQSRLSNASHMSVLSNQSGLSRCSSPHKMVLETSFCGAKPPGSEKSTAEGKGTKGEPEDIEKIVLARKHDPTEAIIPEGISPVSPEPITTKLRPEKPVRKTVESVKSDITITVDKPQKDISNNQTSSKISSRIVSDSGIEYIYIPLKGPLPADLPAVKSAPPPRIGKQKLREVKSANYQSKSATTTKTTKSHTEAKPRAKSATPSSVITKSGEEPKYIRIKLKPDRCYSDERDNPPQEMQKPDTLELNKIQTSSSFVHEAPKKPSTPPSSSPKFIKDTGLVESNRESVTPSPSVSRRSSFASLFKNKDLALSPESPTVSGHKRKNTITGILKEAGDTIKIRSRSRSKSRERDSHKSSLSTAPSSTESIDSKTKNKSVLSLFKSGKKEAIKSETDPTSSQETLPSIEGIGKVEFKFNEPKKTHYENPLDAASIRIPLHSPEYYENRSISQDWKTSSQDSQETVIEASSKNADIIVEPIAKHHDEKPQITKASIVNTTSRQSSTSSENVVFSTKLSDSEVFTTKLPKKLQNENESLLKQSLVEKEVTKTTEKEIIKVEVNGIEPKQIKPQVVKEHPKESVPTQIIRKNSKEAIVHIQKEIPKEVITEKEQKESKPQHVKESLIERKKLGTDCLKKRISQLSEGAVSNVSSNADDDRNSSESEREAEESIKNKKEKDLRLDLEISEPERKAIVLQQDSFEDELPYVPTTLPQERSAAIPIVPVKQRSTFEIKTYPIERPRSTTPINPSCLEEYCEEVMGSFNIESVTKTIEKLKISLPRNESFDKTKPMKSPRKKESNQNWQEFAEKSLSRSTPTQASDTPPPLPPKNVQKAWINFEDIPEKRKAPKRIQTIPSRSYIEVPESVLQESVVYNYVNPEECKCECHEINAKERERRSKEAQQMVQEDELPLLEDDIHDDEKGPENSERVKLDVGVSDCRSIISDSSVDLSTSIDPQENSGTDALLRTPFTSDLGISSNRSSIVSQDEPQSPGSPNAFPKVS